MKGFSPSEVRARERSRHGRVRSLLGVLLFLMVVSWGIAQVPSTDSYSSNLDAVIEHQAQRAAAVPATTVQPATSGHPSTDVIVIAGGRVLTFPRTPAVAALLTYLEKIR